MHNTIETACPPRFTASIPPAGAPVHSDLTACIRAIPPVMKDSLPKEKPADILARSEGVMTRVRMVNTNLRHHGIDCSRVETLAGTGSSQLQTVQAMVCVGNQQGTRSAMLQFRQTVTLLRDAYREILIREDLPGETAHGVLSVAQSLDVTAVKAGIK